MQERTDSGVRAIAKILIVRVSRVIIHNQTLERPGFLITTKPYFRKLNHRTVRPATC